MEKSGKELSADQRVAVGKYGELAQTLEFARDFAKQMHTVAAAAEKELKKRQRTDELAKKKSDVSRIREVLIMQSMLAQLSAGTDDGTPTNAAVRDDHLLGTNGASKLEAGELELMDAL